LVPSTEKTFNYRSRTQCGDIAIEDKDINSYMINKYNFTCQFKKLFKNKSIPTIHWENN
jgi:hypothetical protein